MRFNLLISGGLYSSQAAYSALNFAKAALKSGHQISQVFFYQDGVSLASRIAIPLADEFDAPVAWADLAQQHSLELIVCVSAGERRGVISEEQATEFAKDAANLHPSFTVAGLGVLHSASLESDRTVSFK